ncbi:MAG: type II secretion system minor pseudopilin GspH [Pseudomonadota bacterium]
MAKLATGRSSVSLQRVLGPSTAGYSLIELLVVIVIAGLLTSVVVLRFSADSDQQRAETSLARLDAAVDLLCTQALLNGQIRGLRLSQQGYDFWRLHEGQWQPLNSDQPPHQSTWPDRMALEIQVNQRRLSRRPSDGPQVWCSALDPMTPFSVTLRSGSNRWSQQWPVIK